MAPNALIPYDQGTLVVLGCAGSLLASCPPCPQCSQYWRKIYEELGGGGGSSSCRAAADPPPASPPGSSNACEKTSFAFLRQELPVRLSNIMKEINLLPDRVLRTPSVQLVQSW